jgi:hypothetical protein
VLRKRTHSESPSALAVEVEYGAADNAADRPRGAHGPDIPGSLTEPERRERVAELLSGAVYRYLKRRGKLSARAGQEAGHAPRTRPGPGSEILDDSLDLRAQPTGTYD